MIRKIVLGIMLASLLLAGMTTAVPEAVAQEEPETGTLMDALKADDRLESFVDLVQAGALADNLNLDGPFTVFAPTDAAFDAFNDEDVAANLTEILLYHVVNGNYPAQNVVNHESFTTLVGDHVQVDFSGETVMLDGNARIIATDIQASNGTIHVIDAVLVPPRGEEAATAEEAAPEEAAQETAEPADTTEGEAEEEADTTASETTTDEAAVNSLEATLAGDGRFDMLLSLLRQTGLLAELEARDDLTLFAPTDAAFAQISQERMGELTADPQGELRHILLYHVVGDSLTADQIANDEWIPTVEGRALRTSTDEAVRVYVDDVQITQAGIDVSNGTVHVVEEVLIP